MPRSLTPSREPSAYMKGNRPPSGTGPPPGVRVHRLGKECQFLPTLAPPPSCMARVPVGPLARCMPPLARPRCPPLHPQPLTFCVPSLLHHQPPPMPPPPHRGVPTPARPTCWGAQGLATTPRGSLPSGQRWHRVPTLFGDSSHPAGRSRSHGPKPSLGWGTRGVGASLGARVAPQTCAEQCPGRRVHEHMGVRA